MQKSYRLASSRMLSILAGIVGLGAAVSAPAIAQMSPGTMSPGSETAPAGVMQPSPGQVPTEMKPVNPSQAPAETMQPSSPGQVPASEAPATRSTSTMTLSELLQQGAKAGSFKTLAKAVEAAGLTQSVQDGSALTVFAPTDKAFAALPAGTLNKLLKPENKALLRAVLAYHVVPSTVLSSDLKTGLVKTLGGGLAVRVNTGKVMVNDASVIQADITASNGVVHAIDRVLISPALKQRLISLK